MGAGFRFTLAGLKKYNNSDAGNGPFRKRQHMFSSGLTNLTRPWWQYICRAGAAVGVLLVAAYVTLPLWLPGSLLSRTLAENMSRQVGSAVRIESLSASWAHGLRIEKISVAMPEEFGSGDMLTIERIEADFSPLRLLFANRIEWMSFDGLSVEVRLDHQGGANIASLAALASDTVTERVSIRGGLVSINLPDEPDPIRFNLTDVRYLVGESSRPGRVTVVAEMQQGQRKAPITVRFAPAINRPGLLATAAISISGLDLGELNWSTKFTGPLGQLSGLFSGSVELDLDERLVADRFAIVIDVTELDGRSLAGPGLPVIDKAGITAQGTIDLLARRVTIENLNLSLPGVNLTGKVNASFRPELGWIDSIDSLDLTGQLAPAKLSPLISGRQILGDNFRLVGPVGLDVKLSRSDQQISASLTVDTKISVPESENISANQEIPVSLSTAISVDMREWTLTIDDMELVFGRNQITGRAKVRSIEKLCSRYLSNEPIRFKDISADLGLLELSAAFEIQQWDTIGGLGIDLGPSVIISGPLTGKWTLDNTGQTRLRATVSAPTETYISIGPFVKRQGQLLEGALAGLVDVDSMSISGLYLDLAMDDWKLSLDQVSASLGWDGSDLGFDSRGRIELTDLTAGLSCIEGITPGPVQVSGSLSGSFNIQANASSSQIELDMDLNGLGVCYGDTILKQPGCDGAGKLLFRRHNAGSENQVDRFGFHIQTSRYAAMVNGSTRDIGSWPWPDGNLTGSVQLNGSSQQPGEGLELLLDQYDLAGQVDFNVDVSNGWVCAELNLADLTAKVDGRDVVLDGMIGSEGPWFEDPDTRPRLEKLNCQLWVQAGPSEGWVVADLADFPDGASGLAYIMLENLDGIDLADWIVGPAPQELPTKLSAAEIADLDRRADRLITLLGEYLMSADLEVELTAQRARVFDKSVGQAYDLNDLYCTFSAKDGRIDYSNISGLNGGTLTSQVSFDLTEPDPQATCYKNMSNLVATPSLQPQLAKYFPGNTVEDLFNRTEQTTVALRSYLANLMDWRYPHRPVGTAETLAVGGFVEGSGAPEFVTAVFPGLNLTKYRYKKMTSFAEFAPDGTAVNDMIFAGDTYNLYMEGQTDPDNFGEYEIGLLLASKSPHWQHRWKQGRIPVLKFTGLIEGGKIHDQKISYFWPDESLFIMFLKNNIFYRMWLNGRQD